MRHHIIKRQTIDLKINRQLNANEIQDRVSRVCKDQLINILCEYLDDLSEPNRIDRVDILEIDLGEITSADLEDVLIEKLQEQLYLAQPKIRSEAKHIPMMTENELPFIGNQSAVDFVDSPAPQLSMLVGGKPLFMGSQSASDLVAFFLQTGTLPWWVKEDQFNAFKNAMNLLLTRDSATVTSFFGSVLRKNGSLQRLVLSADEELLDKLLMKVSSRYEQIKSTSAQLHHYMKRAGMGRKFSTQWWSLLLADAFAIELTISSSMQVLFRLYFEQLKVEEVTLLSVAVTPYSSLADFYQEAVALAGVLMQVVEMRADPIVQQQYGYVKEIAQVLDKRNITKTDIATANLTQVHVLMNKIRSLQGLTPIDYQQFWHADQQYTAIASDARKNKGRFIKPVHQNAPSPLGKDGRSLAERGTNAKEQGLDPEELVPIPFVGNDAFDVGLSHLSVLQASDMDVDSVKLVSSFSDTDRLYIPNSGLVLLWPYLERFFLSVGLIEHGGFIDFEKATQACLLLQYITEGAQWQGFEPDLPLNKILCGIDLYAPVDVNIDIKEDEFAAADHLLEAVIGNAPSWKGLSVEGLRSAYLQRDGILSSRDGNWVLQIQRQTYDILLDRLPWTMNIIKLPWMDHLIFVEW